MRKLLPLFVFLAAFCTIAAAQQSSDGDPIGSGNEYGCSWSGDGGHIDDVVEGRVVGIIDGDTVMFLTADGVRRRINLIAVDASLGNKAAKDFLKKNLLNRETPLIVSSSQHKKKNVKGLFRIDGISINAMLLERGLARYKFSRPYQISHFEDCMATNSEKKAKDAKLGIWSK